MKKRIIACVYILMLLVCFKLAFTYLYNEYIISRYDDGDYSVDVDGLLFANCIQPYLAHYNMGNIHYKNKDYESAIEEYRTALDKNPGKEQECDVRINLALAVIGTMASDYGSEKNVEDSIAKLKEARAVLLENDCATENGDGHNETAEKLKREIDELLDELENQETQKDDNGGDTDDDSEEKDEDKSHENEVKEKLQQQQNDSYKERMESLQNDEEYDMDFNFDSDGRVW